MRILKIPIPEGSAFLVWEMNIEDCEMNIQPGIWIFKKVIGRILCLS